MMVLRAMIRWAWRRFYAVWRRCYAVWRRFYAIWFHTVWRHFYALWRRFYAGVWRPTYGAYRGARHRLSAAMRWTLRPPMWDLSQFPARPLYFPRRYTQTWPSSSAPRFAIVTPSFNHADFINATIGSIFDQHYPAVDYFVKDAGSTDGTVAVLKSYGSRLRWRSEPDQGQAQAINLGFRHVEGELMAWLNSDDMLAPGALAAVARFFQANPEVDMVYGHRVFVDPDGCEIGRAVLPPHDAAALCRADYVPQESLFWRRPVWERLGGLDESFHYALDWDFLLRAQSAGFRIARLPRFLGCFRVHERQKTSAKLDLGLAEQAILRARWVAPDWTWSGIYRDLMPYMLRQHAYQYAWRLGLLRH